MSRYSKIPGRKFEFQCRYSSPGDWKPPTAILDPATAAGQCSTAVGQLQRPSSVLLRPPEPPEPSKTPRHRHDGIVPCHISSRRNLLSGIANRWPNISSKKSLNVDSPSFTPAQLPGGKKSTFSTNATPFTPRGAASCKFDGPSKWQIGKECLLAQ